MTREDSIKVLHDLNIGRSAEETLRVIQALQTGGLCQAEWEAWPEDAQRVNRKAKTVNREL